MDNVYQNSANGSVQPSLTGHQYAASTSNGLPDTEQFNDADGHAFFKRAYEKMKNERDRLQEENILLEIKNTELEKDMGNKHVDKAILKVLQDQNEELQHVNLELEETTNNQLEKISVLERHLKDGINSLYKMYKIEVLRLRLIDTELEDSNVKYLEKISALEKQLEGYARDEEIEDIDEIDDIEMNQPHNDFKPLVIKELLKLEDENEWHATLDESEEPVKISIKQENVSISGAVCQKKLILEGVVTQLEGAPFKDDVHGYDNNRLNVSHLLSNVLSCSITDLALHRQDLSFIEYSKLVSSGKVQNLQFFHVNLKYRSGKRVLLEKMLQKLPNIENILFNLYVYISKETFNNLVQLPTFEKLREFKLNIIRYKDFDAESFLDFMKKHPRANFSLLFYKSDINDDALAELERLNQRAWKLEIDFF